MITPFRSVGGHRRYSRPCPMWGRRNGIVQTVRGIYDPDQFLIRGSFSMSRSIWLSTAGLALLTSTAAVGVLAAPAQAATTGVASVSGTKVVFTAGSNKTNRIVITRSGRTVTI